MTALTRAYLRFFFTLSMIIVLICDCSRGGFASENINISAEKPGSLTERSVIRLTLTLVPSVQEPPLTKGGTANFQIKRFEYNGIGCRG